MTPGTTTLPPQAEVRDQLRTLLRERGEMRTRDAVAELGRRMGVPPETLESTEVLGAKKVRLWDRHVRWARQQLKAEGSLAPTEPGVWAAGDSELEDARPSTLFAVFFTDLGFALWGDAVRATERVEDEIVDLMVTSPPYPLLRQKAYGNLDEASHVDWLADLFAAWKPKFKDTASLALNVGDAYMPGRPILSLWKEMLLLRLEDLGYRLAGTVYWQNPSKLPSPAEWVTVRRSRITLSVEPIYWLSVGDHPKADNREVLRPYSRAMERRIEAGGEAGTGDRPSGHVLDAGSFGKDNGGSIPNNLLIQAHSASRGRYLDRVRESGLPVHPARFPMEVPDFFIRLCTDEGDVVADPLGGSGTTSEAAERLGRRWITGDRSLAYLRGAALRLRDRAGFRTAWPQVVPEQRTLFGA